MERILPRCRQHLRPAVAAESQSICRKTAVHRCQALFQLAFRVSAPIAVRRKIHQAVDPLSSSDGHAGGQSPCRIPILRADVDCRIGGWCPAFEYSLEFGFVVVGKKHAMVGKRHAFGLREPADNQRGLGPIAWGGALRPAFTA